MKTMFLDKLGTFHLERVLVKCEYPILFTCQNEKGRMLLFLEMDSNEQYEKWVAIDITSATLNKLYRKEITIQKVFINTDTHKYFVITHDFAANSYSYEKVNKMPDEVLVDGEDYLDIEDDYNEILESAKDAMLRNNSPVLDIHLNPYSHKHSISASLLSFITSKISACFNYSTNKRGDNLMVEFQPGSFVLRFYSKIKEESIIPSETSESAFNTLSNILGSNDVETMSNEFIQTPKLVNPAKELISRLSKEKEDFDVFVTSDINQKATTKSINVDNLISVNKQLKEYKLDEKKNVPFAGELFAYNSSKKTFGFKANNGDIMNGSWEKGFVDSDYTIHKNYNAIVNIVEEKYNHNQQNPKKRYKLVSLEAID